MLKKFRETTYLMQDLNTLKFHGTPRSMKEARNGEDKDIWIPSMERELLE